MRITALNPQDAYDGSYYTIVGAGGNLDEWINGYEDLLQKESIGTPKEWFLSTGEDFNNYAQPVNVDYAFKTDLTMLHFSLAGLDTGKLALFRLRMDDKWYDDMVDNVKGNLV